MRKGTEKYGVKLENATFLEIVAAVVLIFFIVVITMSTDGTYSLVLRSKGIAKEIVNVRVKVTGEMENGIFYVTNVDRMDPEDNRAIGIYAVPGIEKPVYIYESEREDKPAENEFVERLDVTVPASSDSLNDSVEKMGAYYYVEPHVQVYGSEIFEVFSSKSSMEEHTVRGFWNYITSGDGVAVILTTCVGVILFDIWKEGLRFFRQMFQKVEDEC